MGQWFGVEWVNKELLWMSYLNWLEIKKFKRVKKGNEWVVWMAVIWNMWISRNAILVKGIFFYIKFVVGY